MERPKDSQLDEDRPEIWAWHLLGLVNPVVVIAGNVLGGVWVGTGVIFMLGLGPLLDVAFGKADRPKPPRNSGLPLEVLLFVHAVAHLTVLATLFYRAALDEASWTTLVAALSAGLSSGVSGIIVAHEFGHTKPRSCSWWIGRFNLLSVLYLHFTAEHNITHHRYVATRADPATARRGESFWAFLIRTIPTQFLDAVAVYQQKGRKGWRNPILQGMAIQIGLVVAIFATTNAWVTVAFLLQASFAIFLLEYINYIRHYGLLRETGERQTSLHSWQAEERWSRWTLLELTRHPAHHLHASERFWCLQPYEDAPNLPSGYYGCFWLALIPPLWRRVMHSRLAAAREARSYQGT